MTRSRRSHPFADAGLVLCVPALLAAVAPAFAVLIFLILVGWVTFK